MNKQNYLLCHSDESRNPATLRIFISITTPLDYDFASIRFADCLLKALRRRRQRQHRTELRAGRDAQRRTSPRRWQLRQHRRCGGSSVQRGRGEHHDSGLQLHQQDDRGAEPRRARDRRRLDQLARLRRRQHCTAQRQAALVERVRLREEHALGTGAGAIPERQRLGAQQR